MGRLLSSIGATHTTARRRRACTHVQGRRRISRDSQTVRIGGQIIIRSHNRACPFLLLAFSPFLPRTMRISTLHLWFIAISTFLSLSACKCLHGTPTWTRTFVLLVSRTLSFLSPNRPPPIPESEVPRWSCVYKDRLFRVFSRRRFDLALPLDRLTRTRENDVDTAISGTALLRAFQRESLWIVLFNSDRNWRERVDDGGFEKRRSIEALITLEAIVFLAGNDMGRCWGCCDRHRAEIEPEIACYLFFLRGCDWTLPKSFVPTPCRHTRSDRGTASYLSPSTARNHRGEYTLQCSFDPYCWTAVDVHPSRALNYPLRRSNPFIPFGENVRQNFFSSRNIAPRNIRAPLFISGKERILSWLEKEFREKIRE